MHECTLRLKFDEAIGYIFIRLEFSVTFLGSAKMPVAGNKCKQCFQDIKHADYLWLHLVSRHTRTRLLGLAFVYARTLSSRVPNLRLDNSYRGNVFRASSFYCQEGIAAK